MTEQNESTLGVSELSDLSCAQEENKMKASEAKCSKCGQNAMQAAKRGAYLKRTSQKGTPCVEQCFPSCEHKHGNGNEAIVHGILGT